LPALPPAECVDARRAVHHPTPARARPIVWEFMRSDLGMTLETVSRTVSRFQKRGLIDTQRKHIKIVDLEGLRQV
jgi:CRP-like cAMP-binding protein